MSTRRFMKTIAAVAVLSLHPVFVTSGVYSLTVAGERQEYVPQPEKGYVVKLAEKAGGIHALTAVSALDAKDAREVRGLDRRGVWTAENEGPAGRNQNSVRLALKVERQVEMKKIG